LENLFNSEDTEAPFGPLPPCPKSSPSNSIRLMPDEEPRSGSNTSSSANLSSIPKTEVEVFEFREVEASPCKNSREAGAQTTSTGGTGSSPHTATATATANNIDSNKSHPTRTHAQSAEPSLAHHVTNRLKCEKGKSREGKQSKQGKEQKQQVLEDLQDDDELELELPGSEKSSACDCPAHIHDRESPLLIAQVRDAVRVSRTIKNSLSDTVRYDF